jgi:hypothetical protein
MDLPSDRLPDVVQQADSRFAPEKHAEGMLTVPFEVSKLAWLVGGQEDEFTRRCN